MKVGIMQPYFLPYIGYFQLIAAVDLFILYDNIKYTKKGWINRNRMLQNGKDIMFSLPLKSASDYLDVRERELSNDFRRDKLLSQIKGAYRRAPYFAQTFALVERVVLHEETNLFDFLHHSIAETCAHLGIITKIRPSSNVAIDHDLKGQDKVLALCSSVGGSTYINPIGGITLYSKKTFHENDIDLKFIQSESFNYAQFSGEFIPWLSIVDVLMFQPVSEVVTRIHNGFYLL
jgi:hypothetical protein